MYTNCGGGIFLEWLTLRVQGKGRIYKTVDVVGIR